MKNGDILRGPAGHQRFFGDFERIEAVHADADDDADVLGELAFDFKTAVGHGLGRSAHGVVNEEIHFFDLFRFDIIFGFEVRHFAGDTRGKRISIEAADLADTRAAGHQRLPILFDSGTQWRDQTNTRHDNSACFS